MPESLVDLLSQSFNAVNSAQGIVIALILGPVFNVELNKIPLWIK